MLRTEIDNAGFIPATPFRQADYGSCESMMRNRSLPFSKAVLVALGVAPLGLVPIGVFPSAWFRSR